eukprot:g42481.t1
MNEGTGYLQRLHGPDNITVIVLKNCPPELAVLLAKLFQYSYNTGIYSTMWKIAQHLLSNNLLSDAQFRFRQGHSVPDLIAALVHIWINELNSRGE